MKSCILSDRLYVPEEYVKHKQLAEFCYSIQQDDTFDYGPFETGVGSIRTFTKKRLADGQIYYGFARGNMQKIGRLFGDLPWSDQTSAPALQYDLKFNGKLYTYETKKIGQQEAADEWLRCKVGLLKAPPRFGKTITSIYLITKIKTKTLIVTHQWDLLEQYYKSFSEFTNIDKIREPSRKKRDARGQVFGYFTDYDNPEELDVCLLCWQTFASKAKGDARIDKYKNTWGMVIVDECHPFETPVLIDYDKYMPIGEVYNNPKITHVLSYNLEKKCIEKKKILNRRCHDSRLKRLSIYVRGERGLAVVCPTENHKYFVVGRGYVEAKDLQIGDKLITYDGPIYRAKYCSEPNCDTLFVAPTENPASISGKITHHLARDHGAPTFTTLKKCPYCDYRGYSISGHLIKHDAEKLAKKRAKLSEDMLLFAQTELGKKHREQSSARMKANNPTYNPVTRKKIGDGVSSAFWDKSEEEQDRQVARFQPAPRRQASPTKRETEVIVLGIPNLQFTGNGAYYVTLEIEGRKRRKNPDFIYTPKSCSTCKKCKLYLEDATECQNWEWNKKIRTKKVVELMDYEYWHSTEENEPLKKAYEDAGIECLILDSTLPLDEIRATIEAFINNHYVVVESLLPKIVRKDRRVYNLEVEDNHNYFVVANAVYDNGKTSFRPTTPLLVSNCHRVGGLVFAKTVNRLAARYRMGLTGTVERTDGREFLVKDILGTVSAEGKVATVDCKVTVIHTGVSIKYGFSEPLVYLHKRLYNAAGRMQLVLKYAMRDIDAGRFICMAFHAASIEQLTHWTKKLQLMGVSAEAFYGSCEDREGVLNRARSGETQVLVCNRQMLTGIDIPRWDTFYNLFPSSNVVFNDMGELSGNYYQEFSRIRTPYTDKITGASKKEGIIRDFVDKNPFCYGSYRKRYKAYVQQQFNIEIIKEEGADDARKGKGLGSR